MGNTRTFPYMFGSRRIRREVYGIQSKYCSIYFLSTDIKYIANYLMIVNLIILRHTILTLS